MGMVSPDELWALWKLAEVKAEHVMGQVIQLLMAHNKELKALRFEVEQLKQQVADLQKG